jgi:hypothetical protein
MAVHELFESLDKGYKTIPAYLHWAILNIMHECVYTLMPKQGLKAHPAMVASLHDAFIVLTQDKEAKTQ